MSPDAIIDSESCEEFDTSATIDAICGVLEKNGHEAVRLGGDLRIIDRLRQGPVDFVFNIAEGYNGRNRESHIPSVLELLGMPYSGSDPLTLGLTLDKVTTKRIAAQAGIPVPAYRVIRTLQEIPAAGQRLNYPLITKPAWEGSSKGIYNSSKVYDMKGLEAGIRSLLEKYPDQPVLVEEYIEGREITTGVIGNDSPQVLGLMEIVNKKDPDGDVFYSLETKRDWKDLIDYASPPDIDRVLDGHIRHFALSAFREFGCRDIARVDFRVSRKDNSIFMLELNPLPGLSPEYADIVIMARMQGMPYEELIISILNHALSRYRNIKGRLSHETV